MLDVDISSTRRILAFWKLDRGSNLAQASAPPLADALSRYAPDRDLSVAPLLPTAPVIRVHEVIERATRNAGLMK